MSTIDRSPARLSARLGLAAGAVALAAGGLYAPPALPVAVLGLASFVAGVRRGSWSTVTLGALLLLAGAMAGGIYGAPVEVLLAGVTAAVLAWDLGQYAIGVGEQLGREADTVRIEAVHAATSALAGSVVALFGYGLYRTVSGAFPLAAFVFLAVAGILIAVALS